MRRLSILVCGLAAFLVGPANAQEQPAPLAVPEGIVIGSVPVGGMAPEAAHELVRAEFALPLVLTFPSYVFEAAPEALATPAIQRAVDQALVAPPHTTVPLQVSVNRAKVRAYVGEIGTRLSRPAIDAQLFLRRLKPWIRPERPGRVIDRAAAERDVVTALTTGARRPVTLRARTVTAKVTRKSLGGPVIVIRRDTHRLNLYNGMRYRKQFGVATGTTRYPTPLGRFRVVVKWKNPWWYPPDSDWAKDKDPVPPGPSNPLGTRWMGISSPGVGIHGTPEPGSIGYSVSHGCIRMRISDAEWLFERIGVGTTVFIVAA
jgi:lipoprotein-anchoring transpeptidase ErfK/SrfK